MAAALRGRREGARARNEAGLLRFPYAPAAYCDGGRDRCKKILPNRYRFAVTRGASFLAESCPCAPRSAFGEKAVTREIDAVARRGRRETVPTLTARTQ